MRARSTIFRLGAAVSLALAAQACAPASNEAADAQPAQAADDARAYFQARFAGDWYMDARCQPEGRFSLSADRLQLYDIGCAVQGLTRHGDAIIAQVSCTAEGAPQPQTSVTLTPLEPGVIAVTDGSTDWTRRACGD